MGTGRFLETAREIQGDGPVRGGAHRPSQGSRPLGLPLGHGPPDCPDTSLHYHSRHWTTSFQCVAVWVEPATAVLTVNEFGPSLDQISDDDPEGDQGDDRLGHFDQPIGNCQGNPQRLNGAVAQHRNQFICPGNVVAGKQRRQA